MFSKKMRRLIPLALATALCVAPLSTAHAGPARKGESMKRTASQAVPSLLAGFWNHLVSAWGKAGPSIDPSGGGGTGTGSGNTGSTGNGASTPAGQVDPNGNG